MSDKKCIVTIARSWIGTPYRHQAATKSAGTDCLGLIRGVWRELNGFEPESVPPYSMDWSEPQGEERLWEAAKRHLIAKPISVPEMEPGEIVLFRMKTDAVAKHLGLIADTGKQPTFIHAYSYHGVVESPLSEPWRRRIVARFIYPLEII
ncbi:NlpC/P60 family protein [Sedimentitalea sp. JM2-8]|uniref:NlpC/P60 family protein n=1 Tax=Sedimentitalea xiamensis TaxID=3050037 RepID=A0ABT7FCV5_9RHOB|nr:NlpC/P60 family protein [Sedimentitalea xiamensis]MDK3072953.1 NlpC/P60 family protein [Sedimentitalea xiamensis]